MTCSIICCRSISTGCGGAERRAPSPEALARPEARVLDLCCGTGDMAFALYRRAGKASPADPRRRLFPRHAAAGPREVGQTGLRWVEADALHLPFPDGSFDLVSTAFGFRNLADYDAGLEEILRVLRPGGECGILDFGEPQGLMGQLYRIYFKRVLPAVGTLLSGVRGPYRYLPASVERFPDPSEMLDRMRQAGFEEASWKPYTFGIAGLYRGRK